ncbi:MAG: caspase family protein, partial [Ferruginibacter sp.]
LSIFFLSATITAQNKHALIVAIGDYPYWTKLSSMNDVDFIKKTLTNQGFETGNISIVSNQKATHAGITNALQSLIDHVKAGDIVVIHFSSHGEQLEDDNGDESDRLDETIVTFNAVPPDDDGHFEDFQKAQREYLRDDEFGSLVNQLRIKLGKNGDVIVFMDLCHSGSGTRGSTRVRGNKPPGVSLSFNRKKNTGIDTAVFREKTAVRGDENAMATYVVISAARAEELDNEIINNDENKDIPMGSLSYAISKVFATLAQGTTYRSLFSRIQAILEEKVQGQHAVLEGNGIDRAVFGGSSVYQKPFVEIDNLNGQMIRIKAGLLSGLDIGAKVAVYPSGTIDPAMATPLASGKVVQANSYTAEVSLDKDPGLGQVSLGWVFVTETIYNTKPINIRVVAGKENGSGEGFSPSEIIRIKEGMKDLPLIKFDGEPELILTRGMDYDSIKVAFNGYLFDTVATNDSGLERLKEKLQRYSQYRFLKSLPEVKDPDIKIEVMLVPVIDGKADTGKINSKIVAGNYEYNIGDKMVIWVKNKGTQPFYFNILDMQPDGIINAVLPQKREGITADDLKVEGLSSHLFDKYVISLTPPEGQEIFKIFASKDRIDLEDIATTRGASTRGNLSFLETLVKKSYDVATRGAGDVENVSNANGKIFNLLFRINPRK